MSLRSADHGHIATIDMACAIGCGAPIIGPDGAVGDGMDHGHELRACCFPSMGAAAMPRLKHLKRAGVSRD